MLNIGDEIGFVPTAYIDGTGNGNNGSETAKKKLQNSKVIGTVVQVNREHRWYRVAYKPQFDRMQHECFKF